MNDEAIEKLSVVLLSSRSDTVLVCITGTLVDCIVSCVVVCKPRAEYVACANVSTSLSVELFVDELVLEHAARDFLCSVVSAS